MLNRRNKGREGAEQDSLAAHPLMVRSVLTLTGRLNAAVLSPRLELESGLELFTVRDIGKEETSSRWWTVGCRETEKET